MHSKDFWSDDQDLLVTMVEAEDFLNSFSFKTSTFLHPIRPISPSLHLPAPMKQHHLAVVHNSCVNITMISLLRLLRLLTLSSEFLFFPPNICFISIFHSSTQGKKRASRCPALYLSRDHILSSLYTHTYTPLYFRNIIVDIHPTQHYRSCHLHFSFNCCCHTTECIIYVWNIDYLGVWFIKHAQRWHADDVCVLKKVSFIGTDCKYVLIDSYVFVWKKISIDGFFG